MQTIIHVEHSKYINDHHEIPKLNIVSMYLHSLLHLPIVSYALWRRSKLQNAIARSPSCEQVYHPMQSLIDYLWYK